MAMAIRFVCGGCERTIMPALTAALLNDGFREADTAAILGGNFLRVLRQVLPTKEATP